MGSAWYVVGLASAGCAGATAGRSPRRSGSQPRRRCSRGSSSAAPSRRTGASRRTSSGSPRRRARCARRGSASRPGPSEAWPSLDRQARAALAPLPAGDPVSIALVRESTVGGVFVGLAAVDGLAPHVLLRYAGGCRAPARPSAARCCGCAAKGRLPDVPGLRHRAGRHRVAPLAPALRRLPRADRQRARGRRARPRARPGGRATTGRPPGPLVVAEGVAGLVVVARARPLVPQLRLGAAAVGRHAAALADRRPRRRADRARAALAGELVVLVASRCRRRSCALPSSDATVAGRRLLLVGGEAAALLVAFAVLAAGAMRRDLAAARRRLTWHGARRWQRRASDRDGERGGRRSAARVVGLGRRARSAARSPRPRPARPSAPCSRESVLSPTGLLLGLAAAVRGCRS